MGITRYPVRIRLSTRIAGPDDHITVPGMTLWTVEYTVTDRGRETSFVTDHVAETAARRMVANLLAELAPGLDPEDAFTDRTR